MTSAIRRVAGGASLLEGSWGGYFLYLTSAPSSLPVIGFPGMMPSPILGDAFIVLSLALFVDGALGLWGAALAYRAGAVLTAAASVLMAVSTWAYYGYPFPTSWIFVGAVGAVIGAVGCAVNILAARGWTGISEQANPMNLPVFG